MLTSIDKFIVAAGGLAVTLGWVDEGAWQDIAAVLTALAVWLVPNK